jgi:hypothetical protein
MGKDDWKKNKDKSHGDRNGYNRNSNNYNNDRSNNNNGKNKYQNQFPSSAINAFENLCGKTSKLAGAVQFDPQLRQQGAGPKNADSGSKTASVLESFQLPQAGSPAPSSGSIFGSLSSSSAPPATPLAGTIPSQVQFDALLEAFSPFKRMKVSVDTLEGTVQKNQEAPENLQKSSPTTNSKLDKLLGSVFALGKQNRASSSMRDCTLSMYDQAVDSLSDGKLEGLWNEWFDLSMYKDAIKI